MQDLKLPQSQDFTPRESSIVNFYENQIKEMQNSGIIGSPKLQNLSFQDSSEILNDAIQFDSVQNLPFFFQK